MTIYKAFEVGKAYNNVVICDKIGKQLIVKRFDKDGHHTTWKCPVNILHKNEDGIIMEGIQMDTLKVFSTQETTSDDLDGILENIIRTKENVKKNEDVQEFVDLFEECYKMRKSAYDYSLAHREVF